MQSSQGSTQGFNQTDDEFSEIKYQEFRSNNPFQGQQESKGLLPSYIEENFPGSTQKYFKPAT